MDVKVVQLTVISQADNFLESSLDHEDNDIFRYLGRFCLQAELLFHQATLKRFNVTRGTFEVSLEHIVIKQQLLFLGFKKVQGLLTPGLVEVLGD